LKTPNIPIPESLSTPFPSRGEIEEIRGCFYKVSPLAWRIFHLAVAFKTDVLSGKKDARKRNPFLRRWLKTTWFHAINGFNTKTRHPDGGMQVTQVPRR